MTDEPDDAPESPSPSGVEAESESPSETTPETNVESEPPDPGAALGGGAGNDLKPATLALLIMLILLGVAATLTGWDKGAAKANSRSSVDLAPPKWQATPAEQRSIALMSASRREAAKAVDRKDKAYTTLIAAYEAYNRADLAAGGARTSGTLQDAYAEYQGRARDYFRFRGLKPFLAVGQALLDKFWAAIKARDPKTLAAMSGGFVQEARTIGLMRGPFLPSRDATEVIGAAFLLRWAAILADERPVDGLVSPAERLLLLRYKISAHRTLTPKRRMSLGRLLLRLQPNFPTDESLAARFATERRWALAARFYRRALRGHEDDQRLRSNVVFCDMQAAAVRQRQRQRP